MKRSAIDLRPLAERLSDSMMTAQREKAYSLDDGDYATARLMEELIDDLQRVDRKLLTHAASLPGFFGAS